MLDINLDDIDFNFQEKLVDEASIVAGNILNIHGMNTFDSPQFRLQYEPDYATMKIINRLTGESMSSVNTKEDGRGKTEEVLIFGKSLYSFQIFTIVNNGACIL